MAMKSLSFFLKLALVLSTSVSMLATPAFAKTKAASASKKKAAAKKYVATQEDNDAMVDAISKGDEAKVKLLQKKGVSLDAMNGDEMTGLMNAADEGDDVAVNELLKRGAKINLKNSHNENALWYAVYSGHDKMALALIKKGADPSAIRPDTKECLMHQAASGGLIELSKTLMKLTPKCAKQKDIDGRTPAESAKSLGYDKLAKILTPKK